MIMTNLTGSPEGYGPPGSNYGSVSDAEMAMEDAKMVTEIVTNGWHQEDSNHSFASSTPVKRGRGRPSKRKLSLDSTDSTSSEILMKKSKLARTLLEEGKHGVIDGRWVCGECGKSLSSASGLDQHLTTVHGEYKFPCDFCNLKFKRKDHVMNHIKRVHECAKKCSKCGKEFIGRDAYAEHMKAVHKIKLTFRAMRKDRKNHVVVANNKKSNKSPEKLGKPIKKEEEIKTEFKVPSSGSSPVKAHGHLECKHCTKRFASDLKLQHHKFNAHKEELMMLPCTLCRRFFTGATCLNRHKNHHHRSSHDFVKCSYCSGVFHEQVSLEAHLKFFHAEEECLFCGSVFTGAFQMFDHISEFHAPLLTPYGHTCGLCGAYYRFRHHAVEHFRRRHVYHWNYVHVARQVYSCPHCQYPFDDWNQMNDHVLTQHGSYGFWYLEPDYVAISHPDGPEDSLTLLPCAVCNDLYHDQVSLDKHIANDHEPFATRRPFNRNKVTFEIDNIQFAAIEDLSSWKVPGLDDNETVPKVVKKRGRKPKTSPKVKKKSEPEPEPVEPPKLPRSKIKKIIIPKKRTLKKRAMMEARRKAKLKEKETELKSDEADNDSEDEEDTDDDDEPKVVDKDNSKIDASNIITGSRTRHTRQPMQTPQKKLPQRNKTPSKREPRKKSEERPAKKKTESESESESESEDEDEEEDALEEVEKRPVAKPKSSQKVTTATSNPPKRRYLIKDDPNIFDDSDEEIMPTPKRRGDPNPKKKPESESESESDSESEKDEESEEERPLSRSIRKPVKKQVVKKPVQQSEDDEESESEESAEEEESESESEAEQVVVDKYDELLLMTPKVTLRTMRKSVIRRYSTELNSTKDSDQNHSDEAIQSNGNEDHEPPAANNDEKENNHQQTPEEPVLMNGHHEPAQLELDEKAEPEVLVDHASKVADLKKDILVEKEIMPANNGNHLENGLGADDQATTPDKVQETPELTAMS